MRNELENKKPKDSDAMKERDTQLMGLPSDPGRDVDEAMKKFLEEVEAIKKEAGLSTSRVKEMK